MKLNSKSEKVLYWIYKAPTMFSTLSREQQISLTLRDLKAYFSSVEGKWNKEFNREWKQAHEAWIAFCEYPHENWLRNFQEWGVLHCDLNAGLDNVHLFDKTPAQIIHEYRKAKARQEKADTEFKKAMGWA
jgi:hypothetical protein